MAHPYFNNNVFVPNVLQDGNTVAWYDYTDLNSFTLIDSSITQWRDKSGNARHLDASTNTVTRPKLTSTGVLFDGNDEYLKTTSFTYVQPEKIYMVVNSKETTSGYIFDGNVNANGAVYGPNPVLTAYAGGASNTTTPPINSPYILRVLFNGSSSHIQVNNNSVATGPGINSGTHMNGFTLAKRGTNFDSFTKIEVKEVILRNVVDTSYNEQTIYDYLYNKYFLPQSDLRDGLILDVELSRSNFNGVTQFYDRSDSKFNGISYQSPTTVFTANKYGKSDGAVQFPSTGEGGIYWNVGYALDPSIGNYTWSGMIYFGAFTGEYRSIWIATAGGSGKGFGIIYGNTTNQIMYEIYGQTGGRQQQSIDYTSVLNTWGLLTITINHASLTCKTYINENLINTRIFNEWITIEQQGGYLDGLGGYTGSSIWPANTKIQSCKIWNRDLTVQEIKQLYNDSKSRISFSSLEKGLIGQWMLDSSIKVTDLTPYEHNATPSFVPALYPDRFGKLNNAMGFSRTPAYGATQIHFGTIKGEGEATITFWFNSSDNTLYDTPFTFWDASIAGGVFSFNWDGTRPILYVGANNYRYWNSILSYLDSKWHLFSLYTKGSSTNDITSAVLSIDKNIITPSSSSAVGLAAPFTKLMLSAPQGIGYSYSGLMSDVRVYNRSLSTQELSSLYDTYKPKISNSSIEKGLIFHAPLTLKTSRNSGLYTTDKTPYENIGTVQTAYTTVMNDYTLFTGFNNSYINYGDKFQFAQQDFTMSVWVNFLSLPGDYRAIAGRGYLAGSLGGYGIYSTPESAIGWQVRNNDFLWLSASDSSIYINTWYNVIMTRKYNATAYLYINGIQQSSSFNDACVFIGSYDFTVGANSNKALNMNGYITDLKLWNRALTATEAIMVYDKGKNNSGIKIYGSN